MTPAQTALLKAGILAQTDPTFVGYRTSGATGAMAEWLNADIAPAQKAWRTSVEPRDTDEATPWINFDNITSAGKRDSYLHAFQRFPRDYSRNTVRKWITDVWGNASVGSDAAAILTGAGLRNITRGEAILGGSNVVSTNSVSGLKLTWNGDVSNDDVVAAVNLP